MKKTIYIAFTSCFCCLYSIQPAEHTFDEYFSIAVKENSGIQAAYNNWESTRSKVTHSNSLPEPKVTFGHFIEPVETRVGPQKFKLGISQMIPWIGKLSSRKDVAKQQSSVEEIKLSLSLSELRLDLSEAFLNLFYLQKSLTIQKDYIDLSKVIEQTAQTRSEVGGSGADAIQAQMELNRLEYELKTLEESVLYAMANVNAILNRDITSRVDLPSDIHLLWEEPEEGFMFRRTDEELKSLNLQMKILEQQCEVQISEKKLIRKNRYPDVTVGTEWIQTGKSIIPTSDSGKDPFIAFISFNLPLWQKTYHFQEKELEAQINRFSKLYTQKLYNVQVSQEKILNSYSDAKRQVDLFENFLIPDAEQSLSILTDAYKTGNVDFERLKNAQTILLKMQLNLERARCDLGISIARFRSLTGGY